MSSSDRQLLADLVESGQTPLARWMMHLPAFRLLFRIDPPRAEGLLVAVGELLEAATVEAFAAHAERLKEERKLGNQ